MPVILKTDPRLCVYVFLQLLPHVSVIHVSPYSQKWLDSMITRYHGIIVEEIKHDYRETTMSPEIKFVPVVDHPEEVEEEEEKWRTVCSTGMDGTWTIHSSTSYWVSHRICRRCHPPPEEKEEEEELVNF